MLEFTSQLDILIDKAWFIGRDKSVHAFNMWLDCGFDAASKVRTASCDL
jgi:hypothetical protein